MPSTPITTPQSRFLIAVYALVAVCAVWILLMPWVPPIAQASMRRFHLTTNSFAAWAIQQPIPSMYNFANTYEIRQWPPSVSNDLVVDPLFGSTLDVTGLGGGTDFGMIHRDHINHYPVRAYTFSGQRIDCCSKNEDRWIVTVSTYRGERVETLTELKALGAGRFNVTRTDVEQP